MNQCCCECETTSSGEEFACIKCGTRCCSRCARVLASATYCGRCAESILDAVGEPSDLAVRIGRISPSPRVAEVRDRRTAGDSVQWIVLVARDQPDLHAHLTRAFSRDHKVEIVLDRRRDLRRNPPGLEDRLRVHGAAVVRRPQP